MKTLATEKEIRDIRKALIVAMAAEDPELMKFTKSLIEVYGE